MTTPKSTLAPNLKHPCAETCSGYKQAREEAIKERPTLALELELKMCREALSFIFNSRMKSGQHQVGFSPQEFETITNALKSSASSTKLAEAYEGLRGAVGSVKELIGWSIDVPNMLDQVRIHRGSIREAAESIRDLHEALAALEIIESGE